MAEYGQWVQVARNASTEVIAECEIMLSNALKQSLTREGIQFDPSAIVSWDPESRYGRDGLKLTDNARAVGVHVVIQP